MKKGVKIVVASNASVALTIDDGPLEPQAATYDVQVDANDEIILNWAVVGNPAEAYEITLTPEPGAQLSMMTGTNPIKSRIPQSRYTSGGFIRFKIIALLMMLLPLASIGGQDMQRKRDQAAGGPASALTSTSQVTIQASPKDGTAQLVVGLRNGMRLEFSTPLNKETDQSDFLSLDGLATGTNFGLNYAKVRVRARHIGTDSVAPGERVCRSLLLPKTITCDAGQIEAFLTTQGRAQEVPDALTAFDDDFFELGWFPGFSIKAKASHEDFKFFETSGDSSTTSEVGGSLAITGFLVRGANRISLGATVEHAYKASKTVAQKCEDIPGGTLQSCTSRPLNRPKAADEFVVRAEWRRVGRTGFSPVVSWRVRERVVGVDLPVFLVSNEQGQLTGGVRAGWRSDSKSQLAIFVTKPLGLF